MSCDPCFVEVPIEWAPLPGTPNPWIVKFVLNLVMVETIAPYRTSETRPAEKDKVAVFLASDPKEPLIVNMSYRDFLQILHRESLGDGLDVEDDDDGPPLPMSVRHAKLEELLFELMESDRPSKTHVLQLMREKNNAMRVLRECLDDVRASLADYHDTDDGSDGPRPNWAMSLTTQITEALCRAEGKKPY